MPPCGDCRRRRRRRRCPQPPVDLEALSPRGSLAHHDTGDGGHLLVDVTRAGLAVGDRRQQHHVGVFLGLEQLRVGTLGLCAGRRGGGRDHALGQQHSPEAMSHQRVAVIDNAQQSRRVSQPRPAQRVAAVVDSEWAGSQRGIQISLQQAVLTEERRFPGFCHDRALCQQVSRFARPTGFDCRDVVQYTDSVGRSQPGARGYYPGKKVSHPCTYEPDAPARALGHSPRWRVGFV